MRRRGLVAPAARSPMGLVVAWCLTERGRALWRCLEPALEEWDQVLENHLVESLERITRIIVNHPSANGWRRGLAVPDRLRRVSLETRAAVEVALMEEAVDSARTGVAITLELTSSTPG